MRRIVIALASLCCGLVGAAADAADPIFDQARLHETRIVIDPRDWEALRENFRDNQYYAANISIDSEVVQQVGIRSRGLGSRSGEKPGLKVDFNKYVKTQEFHGYKTMVLDNMLQDGSFVRERLAFQVFEAMGIPAPQNAFTRLTVNDEYWGVYALVEPISKPFLKARLGQESGNLFDYTWIDTWEFTPRGSQARDYVPLPFQPQTNEDSLDTSGLLAFVATINDAPDSTFVRDVSAFLDLSGFLTYVAVENALAEYDGVVGEFGMNNFYLYQYGGQNRFVFLPWDKDSIFQAAEWPLFQRMDRNVLTRRLLENPAQKQLYVDMVKKAGTQFVNTSFLGPRLEQAYAQIREQVIADTKKPIDNTAFEIAVNDVRGVIGARQTDILKQAQ